MISIKPLPKICLSKKLALSFEKQAKDGSLNPFVFESFIFILECQALNCMYMVQKTDGSKKKSWETLENDIKMVVEYFKKLHKNAILLHQANKKSPCDTLLLMEENKRLKSTQNKLSKENESLKNQLERYVAKYGV
jgi:hypothetical protein